MNINLHIERLVLDGVAADRPGLLEAALAAELTRLLAGDSVPSLLSHDGAVRCMRTAPVVSLSADSAAMGAEVGGAVHAGLVQN